MSIKDQSIFHKKMRDIAVIIMIIAALTLLQFPIVNAKDNQIIDSEACQKMVDQVIKLIPQKRPLSYRHEEIRELFDINSYFTVLNHLKPGRNA